MLPADGRTELLPEETDLHTKLARRLALDPNTLQLIIRGEATHMKPPTPDGKWLDIEF